MPRKLFAQVTVAGRDGAIDFEVTEHALNAMRDLQSVRAFGHNRSSLDALTGRDDSLDLPFGKIGTVGIGIAATGVEYLDEPAIVLMLAGNLLGIWL